MHLLWHLEPHRDYHLFPRLCAYDSGPGDGSIAPSRFPISALCQRYERWRRRQDNPSQYRLHAYLSHFGDFLPSPDLPEDFFDFTVNILQRRHQAFIEHQCDEPIVLLSPGAAFKENFDLERRIYEAHLCDRLIIVKPSGHEGMLSGLWVIPPRLQKIFCQEIPEEIVLSYRGDDIPYWLSLADNSVGWVEFQDPCLENLVEQYQTGELPFPEVSITGEPLASHPYPSWTREEFTGWMAKQSFRFAKTMRWCPHEYILLDKSNLDKQKEYLLAVDYLHRNTFIDQWYRRFQFAVHEDGCKYWHCGGIDLMNRTSKELQRRIFQEDGKDEHGRKLQE
ncbi:MAG: hypothetical protein IIZ25_08950 [Thermoguttaceae bacterium]|nr:hypothetical protein [Thermoguttaceae bacterium]